MKINYEAQADKYEKTRDVDLLVFSILSYLVKPQKGDTMLDFGCGTGNYLYKFAVDYGIIPYGIEPSLQMRAIAQKKVKNAQIYNGDHRYMPFNDNTFNKIFTTDVIHHIDQLNVFFRNIARVAAYNSCFCICTESSNQLSEKYWINYFPSIVDLDLKRFHTIDTIIEEAEKEGWVLRELLTTESKLIAPISKRFMERVREKTLSVFHLLSDEAYEKGLSLMEADYQSKKNIYQCEGYTFILLDKGENV